MCVCGTLLSRHMCLALISFAWHRDRPVSLVFNNSLDSVHLSRSEYSFRIMHSFGQNHFKLIMFFLFSEASCCEQVVSLAFWDTLKTKNVSSLQILAPFQSCSFIYFPFPLFSLYFYYFLSLYKYVMCLTHICRPMSASRAPPMPCPDCSF